MADRSPATPSGFDEWATLAKSDPQAFEDQRRRAIDSAITAAPAARQPRLRRIQWKLDQIRITSPTPMLACLRMNRLLWESLAGEYGLLACLQQPTAVRQRSAIVSATIIPFDSRRRASPHLPPAGG